MINKEISSGGKRTREREEWKERGGEVKETKWRGWTITDCSCGTSEQLWFESGDRVERRGRCHFFSRITNFYKETKGGGKIGEKELQKKRLIATCAASTL